MEAILSSETCILTRSTRRHVPGDGSLDSRHRKTLRPCILEGTFCEHVQDAKRNSHMTPNVTDAYVVGASPYNLHPNHKNDEANSVAGRGGP
jgi:hypothetical protein